MRYDENWYISNYVKWPGRSCWGRPRRPRPRRPAAAPCCRAAAGRGRPSCSRRSSGTSAAPGFELRSAPSTSLGWATIFRDHFHNIWRVCLQRSSFTGSFKDLFWRNHLLVIRHFSQGEGTIVSSLTFSWDIGLEHCNVNVGTGPLG